MSTVEQEPTRLRRVRMSWQDYLALPDDVHAEYVDGEALMAPPAAHWHNRAGRRLANLLETSLVGMYVVTEAGYVHETRVRIPDVAVWESVVDEDTSITERVPVLVVEVLSPSTRTEDTLRKSEEYRRAGVMQYWVLDRPHRVLTVLGNTAPGWESVVELDDDHPTGEVTVGHHGTVSIDLAALLAP